MEKQNFIGTIEMLFPIDSSFPKIGQIGERLLLDAIKESDWRDLPTDILALYAAKCERVEAARRDRSRISGFENGFI